MNIVRSRIMALMTIVLSILVLYSAVRGIVDERLYGDVLAAGSLTEALARGSVAQDYISIPLSVLLIVLSILFLIRPGHKKLIGIIGLTGNFFYGYGLYVMQAQYTSIYLVYLAIFSLSLYSMILGLTSFELQAVAEYHLPKATRFAIAVFLFFILGVLVPGWLMRISPAIANHRAEGAYGVFILDLGIVFPALALSAVKLIQGRPFGTVFGGVALIKALTVCLSWGFGEWFMVFNGFKGDNSMIAISSTLTVVSLLLIILYLMKLRTNRIRRI